MDFSGKEVFTFTWRIENFSMCPQQCGEGIESPKFKVPLLPDTVWRLRIYPRGNTATHDIKCYLERIDGKFPKIEPIGCTITALSVHTDKNIKKNVDVFAFLGAFLTIASRGDIFTSSKGLLPNDALTLECRMWKYKENVGSVFPDCMNTCCWNSYECWKLSECKAVTRIKVNSITVLWPIKRFCELKPDKKLKKHVASIMENDPAFELMFFVTGRFAQDQSAHLEIRRINPKGHLFVRGEIKTVGAPKTAVLQARSEYYFESPPVVQQTKVSSATNFNIPSENKLLPKRTFGVAPMPSTSSSTVVHYQTGGNKLAGGVCCRSVFPESVDEGVIKKETSAEFSKLADYSKFTFGVAPIPSTSSSTVMPNQTGGIKLEFGAGGVLKEETSAEFLRKAAEHSKFTFGAAPISSNSCSTVVPVQTGGNKLESVAGGVIKKETPTEFSKLSEHSKFTFRIAPIPLTFSSMVVPDQTGGNKLETAAGGVIKEETPAEFSKIAEHSEFTFGVAPISSNSCSTVVPNQTGGNKLESVGGGVKKKDIFAELAENLCNAKEKEDIWNFPVFIKTEDLLEKNYLSYTNGNLYLQCSFSFSNTGYDVITENFDTAYPISYIDKNNSLRINYLELYRDEKFSDIILRLEGRDFKAHKNILALRSDVFRTMFETNMRERESGIIEISDMDVDTVERLLIFLYTDTLEEDLRHEDALSLYSAANKYNIASLKWQCCCILISTLSVPNVCGVLNCAHLHQDEDLLEAARTFVYKNANETFHSKNWKHLMQTNLQLASEIMHLFLTKNIG